jgi:uncharacterized protein (TIGR04222 family)
MVTAPRPVEEDGVVDPAALWGLSSLWFVIFYAAGLVALGAVTWLARRGVGRAVLPSPPPELGTDELAYLHGGEYRLAETELARLISQQKLRVSRPGHLVADGVGEGLSAVILDAARKGARPGDLIGVAKRAREMAPVVSRLRETGLISSARNRALRWWGPQVLLAAWLVAGAARLVSSGLSQTRPVTTDGVIVLVIPELVLGCLSFAMLCADPGAFRTRAGTALVNALRRARGGGGSARDGEMSARYGPLMHGPAGTVAVSGLSGYPDPDVVDALADPPGQGPGGP